MIHHIENCGDVGELVDGFRFQPLVIFVPGMMDREPHEDLYRYTLDVAPEGVVKVILHNESHGVLSDTLECIVGKLAGSWLARNNTCPEYPARVLRYLLERWEGPVLILAHSQGAILTHNALRGLETTKVHVRTFGGAAWGNPDAAITRHWSYGNDPVSNLFGRGWFNYTQKLPSKGWVRHHFDYYHVTAMSEIEHWYADLGEW